MRRRFSVHAASSAQARGDAARPDHRPRDGRPPRHHRRCGSSKGCHVHDRIVQDRYAEQLAQYVGPGDIIVDLAWNLGCADLLEWCYRNGVRYLNTSVELWDPYADRPLTDRSHALCPAHAPAANDRRLAEQEGADGDSRPRGQSRARVAFHQDGAARHRPQGADGETPRRPRRAPSRKAIGRSVSTRSRG